jgi:hypothetical protein
MEKDSYIPKMTRRQVLRGIGATLTLPWLESLAWADSKALGTKEIVGPPRRWASMVFANGVNTEHWWAKGEGMAMELSKTLQPLMPFRNDILPIDGLRLFEERLFPVHVPYFTNFLSGGVVENCVVAGDKRKQPGGDGKDPRIPDVAQTLDHYLAQKIGYMTPVPCLTLGIEPPSYGIKAGRPQIYYDTISWSDRQTPIAPEIYPRAAFDQLFDASSLQEQKSVLDTVYQQAKSLGNTINHQDREKLNDYMDGIREIERRIELATSEGRLEGWRPTLKEPNMPPPPPGLPQNIPEHMKLMVDIMLLGFQMDKTRIGTLLCNNDTSGMLFDFLEGVAKRPMHGAISHHRKDPETLKMYQKVNQFHVELLAYTLERMKSIKEGNGQTLLDNTMLLFGSTMRDGDSHDGLDLPLILCGRGGGTVKPGRTLKYYGTDANRRLCNLHLAMLQRMGVPDKKFGNSLGVLDEIG